MFGWFLADDLRKTAKELDTLVKIYREDLRQGDIAGLRERLATMPGIEYTDIERADLEWCHRHLRDFRFFILQDGLIINGTDDFSHFVLTTIPRLATITVDASDGPLSKASRGAKRLTRIMKKFPNYHCVSDF